MSEPPDEVFELVPVPSLKSTVPLKDPATHTFPNESTEIVFP